jgi:cystathionine gamma-synthase
MSAFNESQLIHAGSNREAGAPAVPPIVAASIYGSAGAPDPSRAYGRNGNPTWEALEDALGSIEGARALVFASGQAAVMALMLATTEGRDRLVMPSDGYYNSRILADRLRPHGIEASYVDLLDTAAVERELAGGRSVLWVETPTNPLLRVADLGRLAELADAADGLLVVDNTLATGVLQQPLSWGASASLYSLTKAASGHADVVLGAVVSADEALLENVRAWRDAGGGIAGPFEAWLALRGLRTLALRVRRQSASAGAIADHLGSHPAVSRVHYPGLDQATAEVAARQMPDGYGPMLSFELAADAAAADRVVGASRLILPATSFGGVESTWERRARWSAESAPDSLIRLSVGLERPEDLIADIDAALEAAGR